MKQSVFYIEKMDCPAEEQLIRKRLDGVEGVEGVEALRFNLMARELTVTHTLDDDRKLLTALESLGMEPRRKTETAPGLAKASVFTVPGMC